MGMAHERNRTVKGGKMDNLWMSFFWTGPIGVGIFLVCLGAMIYLLAKADEVSKRTKREYKDKK